MKSTGNKVVGLDEMPATLELKDKHLSDIKKWEVGKEYTVVLRVRMVSKNEGSLYDDESKGTRASFKVVDAHSEAPSASERAAANINNYRKKGYSPSQSRTLGTKG